MKALPYRRNVAAFILNKKREIFIALRHDLAKDKIWAFPQGGIDDSETTEEALKRQLLEEIGTNYIEILAEYPEWLSYNFLPNAVGNPLKRKFKGQTQKWFAVRFLGKDTDIDLNTHKEKEFDAWKWISFLELEKINTGFKHDLYLKIATYFQNLV